MPIVLVLIGLALLVTAYNNTFGNLTGALGQDVPGFAKWGVSLAIVGAVGYVPGMQTVSRWLLGLVCVVLVLRSYQQNQSVFQGFANAFSSASTPTSQTDPATAYAANPASPQITSAEVTGTSQSTTSTATAGASNIVTGNVNANATGVTATTYSSPYDPEAYLQNFAQQAGVSILLNSVTGALA